MKKRLTIGVIAIECYSKYQAELYKGIIAQAFKASCNVIFISALHRYPHIYNEHTVYDKKIYDLILADKFDGFIYDREAFYHKELTSYIDKLCQKIKKPIIVLENNNNNTNFKTLKLDEHEAFEKITDHMIEHHNCKKIYFLTGPKNQEISIKRLNGYISSMKKHNLYIDDSYCIYGDFYKDAAVNLARQIADNQISKPDAILCANDHSAAFLCSELIHQGIKVPEDIAVTGYDGYENNLCQEVEITTYKRENFRYGAEAFRQIYRMITGSPCGSILYKRDNLIIRKSCGCITPTQLTPKEKRQNTVDKNFENKLLYSDMLTDVCDSNSIEELMLNIGLYAYMINNVHNVLICLSEDYENALKGDLQPKLTLDNTKNMKVFLDRTFTLIRECDDKTFSVNDILPDKYTDLRFPIAYYITPLHFNKNYFGYAALSFGKNPESFKRNYLHWIRYINVSLQKLMEMKIMQNKLNKFFDPDNDFGRQNPHIKKLSALRQRMIDNPEYEWKVEDMAGELFLSRSYLQKLYKDCFGKGIIEELIDFRIEKSVNLLKNTDKSINDIATECGYTSYSYFSKQFKSIKSISPAEYRKKLIM